MADTFNLSDLVKQLISGTAPGQTIKRKPEGGEAEAVNPFQAEIDKLTKLGEEAAARDDAALALQESLGWAGIGIQQGQLGVQQGQLALAQEAQAFTQEDVRNQRLLEAAGLATGPTGAIQLAYLARGQGAPQEEVAAIFQNLPFIQELLHGQNVPGFGRPEQLGEPTPRTSGGGGIGQPQRRPAGTGGTIEGQGLGVTIPGKRSVTRQAFGTLSQFEQEFLGALGQSETGQSAQGFLEDMIKSFIPTRQGGAISIG